MKQFITNKNRFLSLLDSLKGNEKPKFGLMTPQHMVEHLVFSLRHSNGNAPQNLMVNDIQASSIKYYVTMTNRKLKKGLKSPLLPENDLPKLKFKDIKQAIENLEKEISTFEIYKEKLPNHNPINPVMGPLSFEEWEIFHLKHFNHHLRQFNLIA